MTKKGEGKEEVAHNGHRKARAEVQTVCSSTMSKVDETEKETSDSGRQVFQKEQPSINQKSAIG